MEVDNEVSGNGNSYTTEFRQYDPRLGRWKSLDPLMAQFPWMSPYCAFDNNPVYYVDPYGLSSEVKKNENDPVVVQGSRKRPGRRSWKDKEGRHKWNTGDIYISKDGKKEYTYRGEDQWDEASIVDIEGATASGKAMSFWEAQEAKAKRNGYSMKVDQIDSGAAPIIKHARKTAEIYNEPLNWIVPGREIVNKLLSGEEISATELIVEGIGLIPFGKVFTKGGKLFAKVMKNGDEVVEDITDATISFGCFIEGTSIATENGATNIEDIGDGDLVWSFNDTTNEISLKTVSNPVIRQMNHIDLLVIGSDTIFTTDDHPFWVSNSWVRADELSVGDTLTLKSGDVQILNYFEHIDTVIIVYNFTVKDNHTYFVGKQEILVHNNNPCSAVFKKVSKTKVAQKVYKKLSASTKQQVDKAIKKLKSGGAGGNQHGLRGDLQGKYAIDVKGSGSGRGGLRIVYEKVGDKEIIIHDITDYH